MACTCTKVVSSSSDASTGCIPTAMATENINQTTTLPTFSSSSDDTVRQTVRQSSSQTPLSRITENFILIWLNPTLNEFDDNTQNIISYFQHIIGSIKTFTDFDICVHFLEDITDGKVFMVIADDIGEKLVSLLQESTQLDSIYVFSDDRLKHEQLFKGFQKVKGVFTQIEYLCDALKQDVRQCNRSFTPISIVSVPKYGGNFDKIDQSFMYTQLLKEILLDMPHNNEAKNELVEFCRVQYAGNDTQLKVIDEFEQQYDRPSPIWWYTRECFTYWMLNKALRTQDTEMVMRMSFFLRDLHHQIEQLYLASNNRDHTIVFRGQGMFHSDFEKMQRSEGRFLSFNTFLSTSKDREVSFLYADSARQNRNLVGVLFQIEVDPSISSIPFTSLGNISYFGASEKEVLFSMHTVFRIGEMKQIGNELWEVNLTLSGDNDKLLTPLTKYFRKEIQGESPWHRIGKLMIKMSLFDQAENVYNSLVHSTSEDNYHVLGHLYHQLGLVKHEKGELKNAIAYYEKALEIRQKSLPSQHHDLAATYSNIGSVYQSMEAYPTALECFEKALEIRQECLQSDDPLLAITYNNIGSTYQLMENIPTALVNYEKALSIGRYRFSSNTFSEIIEYNNIGSQYQSNGEYSIALSYYNHGLTMRLKTLGSYHPLFAVMYNNIGSVHSSMAKYSKALSSYTEALDIQQKFLPPYHPSFAITYDDIGLMYLSMKNYSESFSFYEKALQIRHKTLPSIHPDLADSYIKTAKVLENLQRYKEAVEYAERGVEIVRQIFSADHHKIKENQEYLDSVRGKLQ